MGRNPYHMPMYLDEDPVCMYFTPDREYSAILLKKRLKKSRLQYRLVTVDVVYSMLDNMTILDLNSSLPSCIGINLMNDPQLTSQ